MIDIAVIGLGMIGSAALRYLSMPDSGIQALGIGPAEPSEWTSHQGAFASHYDRTRITRITDPDPIWAVLAQRSIAAYPEIARAGGIEFHEPVGHLRVGLNVETADHPLNRAEAIGQELGAPLERLDATRLGERFPYLNIPARAQGLYERGGAGVVNPRALVAAQLAAAQAHGATILRAEVTGMARCAGGFNLTISTGQIIRTRKVLFCAHGYTGLLLESMLGYGLRLENRAHTTVIAEIQQTDAARLAGMPSLIWQLAGHPVLPSVYTTPPAIYPDGNWYLKIGGPLHQPLILRTTDEIRTWFQGEGNPLEIAALRETLCDLVPGLRALRWVTRPCMVSYTAHNYPYIDQLIDDIYVCAGGCGAAAKSSDAIGRLGASLAVHGAWRDELPAATFRAVIGETGAL